LSVGEGSPRGEKPWADGAWRSGRALPASHQIEAGDLREPRHAWLTAWRRPPLAELTGRHLLEPKKKGDSVTPDDLASRPELAAPAGHDVLLYPLAEQPAAYEGGSTIWGCYRESASDGTSEGAEGRERSEGTSPGGATRCVGPASTLAVHRAASEKDVAWLALAVTRAADWAPLLAAESRYLVAGTEPPGPGSTEEHSTGPSQVRRRP
jgi:hypothetical protein